MVQLNSVILPVAVAGEIPMVGRHLCRGRALRPPCVYGQGRVTGARGSVVDTNREGCRYCMHIIEFFFVWRGSYKELGLL